MSDTIRKQHEKAVETLFRDVGYEVNKIHNLINDEYPNDSGDSKQPNDNDDNLIKNLSLHELFNTEDWEEPEFIYKDINLSTYITSIPEPLANYFHVNQFDEIRNEVIESIIQKRPSIYRDSIANGIIDNYMFVEEKNRSIFTQNAKSLSRFYDYVKDETTNSLNLYVASLEGKIKLLKNDVINEVKKDKDKIIAINELVDAYQAAIDGDIDPSAPPPEKNDKDPEPSAFIETMGKIKDSLKGAFSIISIPFIALFKIIKALFGKIKTLIKKIWEQHVKENVLTIIEQKGFFYALLFTIFYVTVFLRLFDNMFEEPLIVVTFLIGYLFAFNALPFFVSMHLKEFNEDRSKLVIQLLLSFEAIIALFVFISYPIMIIQNRIIFGEDADNLFVIIIAACAFPIISSMIIWFVNYRANPPKEKNDDDEDESTFFLDEEDDDETTFSLEEEEEDE